MKETILLTDDWELGYKVNGMKFPENITQINVI